MLELKHISKTFYPGTVNAKTALFDLNLTLNDGDFVTVIGGNWPGNPDETTDIANAAFYIDYVRVYQKAVLGGEGDRKER